MSDRSTNNRYDDAMYRAMMDHSEHPTEPLTELEVFIGHIVNKSGVQTRRQRDRSGKLRDEFNRISKQTMERMRGNKNVPATGYVEELDALELCVACVSVSASTTEARPAPRRSRKGYGALRSFAVVAAAALLKELTYLEEAHEL